MTDERAKRRRGRPRGHPTIDMHLRLTAEQKQSLEVLSRILDGCPPVNGLIQTAIEQYVTRKLQDAAIRKDYEARVGGRLRVIS